MQYHQRCIVCGSPALKRMPRYHEAYLVRCATGCGMVFSGRVPTEQELVAHYEGYGRNDYLSPITVRRYNELLDQFEPFRRTNRIIDVGCGIGYFLEQANKRGWEVFGTEFTDKAVDICRGKGISMEQGSLDVSTYEPGSFDVVTSFEVLEHINTPVEELRKFWALLRPQGLLYLTTPNFNSLLRYYLGSQYNIIGYPEHLGYFTPKTLMHAMRISGFTNKRLLSTGLSMTRFRKSLKLSDQRLVSRTSDDEVVRNAIEANFGLGVAKGLVNGLLSVLGVGDSLKAWLVKCADES